MWLSTVRATQHATPGRKQQVHDRKIRIEPLFWAAPWLVVIRPMTLDQIGKLLCPGGVVAVRPRRHVLYVAFDNVKFAPDWFSNLLRQGRHSLQKYPCSSCDNGYLRCSCGRCRYATALNEFQNPIQLYCHGQGEEILIFPYRMVWSICCKDASRVSPH